MEILTLEEAAKDLHQFVNLVQKESRQYRITAGDESAVLMSYESYQNLIVTLELLATPGLMNGVKFLDPQTTLS